MIPYSQLQSTTIFPETLEVTEDRQFRERGLVHISDNCFQMFMYLEQVRVNLLNNHMLYKHKEDLIDNAYYVMSMGVNSSRCDKNA